MTDNSKDKAHLVSLETCLNQNHTKGTAKRYYRDILNFLKLTGEEKAKTATYNDIMNYTELLRKKYKNPATIKVNIYAIKKYYNWLNHTNQRKTHPCKNLKLRDKTNRDIQLQDLFKPEELELLTNRKERYKDLKNKNQVIISLLIYQALTTGEITRSELKDLNLETGEIYIKSTARTKSRTLKLKTKQIMLFYKYINEDRLKLIKTETDKLIITKAGTPETGDGISYLIETQKHLFPERNLNPKIIRQSVISNLLKQGKDIITVQYFAGHKNPSSTEKYKQTATEELKNQILKYHPLNQ